MKKFFIPFLIFIIGIQFNCSTKNIEQKEKKTQSFRAFLVENDLKTDIKVPNKFETLQPGNKYSNHYLHFSTVLPEEFEIDRGNFENTVIRAFDLKTATSIAIGTESFLHLLNSKKIEERHKNFQENPLEYMNNIFNGDFKNRMLKVLTDKTNLEISSIQVGESKIRSTNFVFLKVEYVEYYNGKKIEFIKTDYQTYIWEIFFSFSYIVPKSLYNEDLILEVLYNTNFTKQN